MYKDMTWWRACRKRGRSMTRVASRPSSGMSEKAIFWKASGCRRVSSERRIASCCGFCLSFPRAKAVTRRRSAGVIPVRAGSPPAPR